MDDVRAHSSFTQCACAPRCAPSFLPSLLPSFPPSLLPSVRLRVHVSVFRRSLRQSGQVRCASFHAAFSRIVLTHSEDGERDRRAQRACIRDARGRGREVNVVSAVTSSSSYSVSVPNDSPSARLSPPSLPRRFNFPTFPCASQKTERTNPDDQADGRTDGRIGDSGSMVERAREERRSA